MVAFIIVPMPARKKRMKNVPMLCRLLTTFYIFRKKVGFFSFFFSWPCFFIVVECFESDFRIRVLWRVKWVMSQCKPFSLMHPFSILLVLICVRAYPHNFGWKAGYTLDGRQLITDHIKTRNHFPSHSHLWTIRSLQWSTLACFWNVGGSCNTCRNRMQAWGVHTNSTQGGQYPNLNLCTVIATCWIPWIC